MELTVDLLYPESKLMFDMEIMDRFQAICYRKDKKKHNYCLLVIDKKTGTVRLTSWVNERAIRGGISCAYTHMHDTAWYICKQVVSGGRWFK